MIRLASKNLCHHSPQVVFVSPFEHHANLLPWRESGAEVVWIAEDPSGRIDASDLERKLKVWCKIKISIRLFFFAVLH